MARTVKLNSGYDFPTIGLGTWQAPAGEVGVAIKEAIDIGYRHFDCAMFYRNEAEVGNAIRDKIADGTVTREEVFVTSKLWNNFHRPELVVPTCKKTLQDLGLDYLDMYLIHWPVAFKEGDDLWPKDASGKLQTTYVDFVSTWKAMEECVSLGLARSIGVSNFNTQQLKRVLDSCTIKPATNQVECHPYLTQKKLLKFCTSKGIVITAYSPLGAPNADPPVPGAPSVLQDHRLKQLANKYNRTVAQVVLRYLVQIGVVPIPKSTNPSRLRENFSIYDFELSPTDITFIDSFNCNVRAYPFVDAKDDVNYPFNME
ncbi:aldo-keto reductase family 1 member B1 [Anabrus simplex]|uniref:aldo-keto reductase family 1 member B1 n=1 Tax=Anabrus simplex TaxID=316456 RepID=UPI0035A27133